MSYRVDIYHYSPDLFDLLVQTIPLLNKSKKSVLTFFRSSGIEPSLFYDIEQKVALDRNNINKFEMVRTILERINSNTDKYLRNRREIIKRVVEFDSFSNSCWATEIYKAKGLIADIQKLVNLKDTLTKIKLEQAKELNKKSQEYLNKVAATKSHKDEMEKIKKDFYQLFTNDDSPQKRGKNLEEVLNSYFSLYNVLVEKDFKRVGKSNTGILEQIDSIIELENNLYLVEMKWTNTPIGAGDINSHLCRIYNRSCTHGVYISASGYTASGIEAAKDALSRNAMLILFELDEFVKIIDQNIDFRTYLHDKINKAKIEREPFVKLC